MADSTDIRPNVSSPNASSPRVGIVVGKYDSQYFGQILDNATQQLESYGYSVISRSMAASSLGVKQVWESLIQSNCVGVILNSQALTDEELHNMISTNPKIVLINRFFENIPLQCVHLDNTLGARLAVEHLIEMGHRNIAMITGPMNYSEVIDRSAGFREAMQKNGLPVSNELIACGDFTSQGGAQAFRQLLRTDSSFSAVFIQSDTMAAGVIEACQGEGISVPTEISMVGFDDTFVASITNPKLTTIRQPISEAGIRAAKTIHSLIEKSPQNVNPQSTQDQLTPELIIRDSVFNQRNLSKNIQRIRPLTPRENECLQWITLGRSSIEIASLIDISEDTVNFHLRNVIRKLNARNRTHAVAIGLTNGMVNLEAHQVHADNKLPASHIPDPVT